MTKDSYNSKKIYSNVKIIKLDPLAESLDSIGLKGGASKSLLSKGVKETTKGVDVIRGTSKKQDVSFAPGNKINDKYQGRFFYERAKTKKADEGRVAVAKSFAISGRENISKKDRLILKTTLTANEAAVGRKLIKKFLPRGVGRYGRIIVPKNAIKNQKVDRKLTRAVRKEDD